LPKPPKAKPPRPREPLVAVASPLLAAAVETELVLAATVAAVRDDGLPAARADGVIE
jgi:hypothetical protein